MADDEFELQREAQRILIRRMVKRLGISITALALRAGVSPSTLTRFLNQPVKHLLGNRTLAKLAAVLEASAPAEDGDLAHEEEKIVLLAIWDDLSREDRRTCMRIIRAMKSPVPDETQPPRRA